MKDHLLRCSESGYYARYSGDHWQQLHDLLQLHVRDLELLAHHSCHEVVKLIRPGIVL